MEIARRGDRRIAWERYGEGPPVVLVPGIGAGAAQFGTLHRRFARAGFTCIVMNPVGIAPSTPHQGDYDFGEAARDLLAVIDAAGVATCGLVAVSMGGKIAAAAAGLRGDQISMLALVGSSLIVTPRGTAVQRFFETAARSLDGEDLALVLAPFLFGRSFSARQPDLVADIVRGMRPSDDVRELMVAQARAARAFDADDCLGRVSCPVLFLAGGEDTIAPAADVRATARLAPRSTVVDIPDAGHSMLLESSRAFEEVVAFLRGAG